MGHAHIIARKRSGTQVAGTQLGWLARERPNRALLLSAASRIAALLPAVAGRILWKAAPAEREGQAAATLVGQPAPQGGATVRTPGRYSGRMAWIVLILACGDSQTMAPPAPLYGSLRVTNATSGPLIPGPSDFQIRVDSGRLFLTRPDSVLTLDSIEAGSHAATISLLRPQCTVPDSSVAISILAADTADVQFAVSCQVIWGFLAVGLPATGPNQPGLLTITFDGTPIGGASPNTAGLGFPYVSAGTHAIGLTGAAGNCALAEPNPQNVLIPLDDTVHVTFTLTCS